MAQAIHLCCNVFHEFAILLSHDTEVALYLLHEYALTFHKVEFLHINLVFYEVCHGCNALSLRVVDGWNHDLSKWLAHFDVHLTAQSQHHGGDALSHVHACFEVGVYVCHVRNNPFVKVYALFLPPKVVIELVSIERSERCEQLCHRHKAGVQRIVSTAFVAAHLLSPEAFTVQTHVPVAQIVVHKAVYQSSSTGWVERLQLFRNLLHQRIEL